MYKWIIEAALHPKYRTIACHAPTRGETLRDVMARTKPYIRRHEELSTSRYKTTITCAS
jgi:hypothetical protein